MEITTTQVKKIRIDQVIGFDSINVFMENSAPGEGALTITLNNNAWTSHWSAMGPELDLEAFLLSCDNDYLAKNLIGEGNAFEDDYHAFIHNLENEIKQDFNDRNISIAQAVDKIEQLRLISPTEEYFNDADNHELLNYITGGDFWYAVPEKPSLEYNKLCKLLNVIKNALVNR